MVRLKVPFRSEAEVLNSPSSMPSNDNFVVKSWYSLVLGAYLVKSGSYLKLEKQGRVDLLGGKR